MTIERTNVVWLESRANYTVDDLAELSGLPHTLLDDLVACGALPVDASRTTVRFEAEGIALARAARRLRDHFELDGQGLAVAVSLLRRVRLLESQLSHTRAMAGSVDDRVTGSRSSK